MDDEDPFADEDFMRMTDSDYEISSGNFSMGDYYYSQNYQRSLLHFEVLTSEQTLQQMNEYAIQVSHVIQMPATVVKLLLKKFRWNGNHLATRFYDDGHNTKLLAEAHIKYPFAIPSTVMISSRRQSKQCWMCLQKTRHHEPRKRKPKIKQNPSANISSGWFALTNRICNSKLRKRNAKKIPKSSANNLSDWFALSECGHRICYSCWSEYLTLKISSEEIGQPITCAVQDCDVLVDYCYVMKLVSDPEVRTKYQKFTTDSFVECNEDLRWCPSPGCSLIIKRLDFEPRPVTCRCGRTFCFNCGENHEPVPCDLLLKWNKMCNEGPGIFQAIRFIEAGPECNRNDEQGSALSYLDSQTNADIQQNDLYYCTLVMNHMMSLRMEQDLYASIAEKMTEKKELPTVMENQKQYLVKAVDVLRECRHTLMYSYIFTYFLKKNHQSTIIEDKQRELESATGELSAYLERDIFITENLANIIPKVLDSHTCCDHRRRALTSYISDGYDMKFWEYDDLDDDDE